MCLFSFIGETTVINTDFSMGGIHFGQVCSTTSVSSIYGAFISSASWTSAEPLNNH
jgi:hypothetical protein